MVVRVSSLPMQFELAIPRGKRRQPNQGIRSTGPTTAEFGSEVIGTTDLVKQR